MTRFKPGRKVGEDPQAHDVVRGPDGLPVIDESVAVLTADEHRRLASLLDAAKKPGSRPEAAQVPTLLASMCRCATCDSVMHRARVGGQYESYRCANADCSAKAGINLPQLTDFVTETVLAERGGVLLVEAIDETPDASEDLGNIEEAIRATTFEMTEDGADLMALTQRLTTLKETRASLRSVQPVKRQMRYPEVTLAEAWKATEDVAERRELLLTQLGGLVIEPGTKARNRFDSARADLKWKKTAGIRVRGESAHRFSWRSAGASI